MDEDEDMARHPTGATIVWALGAIFVWLGIAVAGYFALRLIP